MSHTLYLVRRYLRSQPAKTAILIGSLTLLIYLPAGLQVLVSRSAAQVILAKSPKQIVLIVSTDQQVVTQFTEN